MKTYLVRFILTRTFEGQIEVSAASRSEAESLAEGATIDHVALHCNDRGHLEVLSIAHRKEVA